MSDEEHVDDDKPAPPIKESEFRAKIKEEAEALAKEHYGNYRKMKWVLDRKEKGKSRPEDKAALESLKGMRQEFIIDVLKHNPAYAKQSDSNLRAILGRAYLCTASTCKVLIEASEEYGLNVDKMINTDNPDKFLADMLKTVDVKRVSRDNIPKVGDIIIKPDNSSDLSQGAYHIFILTDIDVKNDTVTLSRFDAGENLPHITKKEPMSMKKFLSYMSKSSDPDKGFAYVDSFELIQKLNPNMTFKKDMAAVDRTREFQDNKTLLDERLAVVSDNDPTSTHDQDVSPEVPTNIQRFDA